MNHEKLHKILKKIESKEEYNQLDFSVIKTTKEFQNNYDQHDKTVQLILLGI